MKLGDVFQIGRFLDNKFGLIVIVATEDDQDPVYQQCFGLLYLTREEFAVNLASDRRDGLYRVDGDGSMWGCYGGNIIYTYEDAIQQAKVLSSSLVNGTKNSSIDALDEDRMSYPAMSLSIRKNCLVDPIMERLI